MSGILRSTARVTALILAVTGIWLLAQRVIAVSNATASLAASLANGADSKASVRVVPSDDQVQEMARVTDRMGMIADNLANAQTVGFKRHRAELIQDPGIGAFSIDMTQGALQSTAISTDLAIQGDGFFRIKYLPDVADGTAYTRKGSLLINRNGDLVVGIDSRYPLTPPLSDDGGYELIPVINIPQGAMNLAISQDGEVSYVPKGSARRNVAGQIMLSRFSNPQWMHGNGALYFESAASGPPVMTTPDAGGAGVLIQGYLETSNVVAVKEWAWMLKAEQCLQLDRRSIQVLDRARLTIASLK